MFVFGVRAAEIYLGTFVQIGRYSVALRALAGVYSPGGASMCFLSTATCN